MQTNHPPSFARPWIRIVFLVAGFLLVGVTMQEPVSAQTTTTYFDEPLAPYGYWVEDPYYGRVWRPRETSEDWRPYTYGRWVYTSEYGWIWASEEPWGWVVYHYGRWVWTGRYGWVWVAGDDWAPAWVEWCYGGGYVGWAPMPPDPYWQGAYYYGSYECTSPAYYSRAVFVSQTYFTSPRLSAYIVAPSQNQIAARATVNVTSYSRVGASVINRSIDVTKLQTATGQTIRPIRVVQSKNPVVPGPNSAALQELKIYRPLVTSATQSKTPLGNSPLKLDPVDTPVFAPSKGPLDTGGLPSLDRPNVGDISSPPLGGLSSPSLGNPSVGGALGGVRGRLGR
jgi:hypothetical protein